MFNTFGNTNPYAAQLQDLQRQLSSLQNTMPAQLQPVPQFQPAAIPQIPTVHGYEGIKAYYVPQSGSVVALDADSDDDKVIFLSKRKNKLENWPLLLKREQTSHNLLT